MFADRLEDPAIIADRGERILAGLGLDPRPFDREAVGIVAERCGERDILAIAMIAICGIARHLLEQGRLQMLEKPDVAADIIALDLVGRARRAPEKGGPSARCGRFRFGGMRYRERCSRSAEQHGAAVKIFSHSSFLSCLARGDFFCALSSKDIMVNCDCKLGPPRLSSLARWQRCSRLRRPVPPRSPRSPPHAEWRRPSGPCP